MDRTGFEALEGRRRVAIENVRPAVDGGRWPVKRIVGETVVVTADVFADGHDIVMAVLLDRPSGTSAWRETSMTPLGNDAWQATFQLAAVGRHEFSVLGWVDAFESWDRDLKKRIEAGQDVAIDLRIGARLVGGAADRSAGDDARRLREWQKRLESSEGLAAYQSAAAELVQLVRRYPDRQFATQYSPPFGVVVDSQRAQFSTWYELFPRSCSGDTKRHGTLRDCIGWLPRLAEMGFDVLYLPPIHPVGITLRKGKNNSTQSTPQDVGSPWAIGGKEGGHKAIHPQLGTLEDLHALVAAAAERAIDVALDVAFQCSPDHPYVREHPEWFRKRPDGTIQYAENPPKKYQDIYPFDFETADWQNLWRELTDVFLYWCGQGIRIFRVDNPHTKPFGFWEYCIGEVKARYPETIFLSEAFTRPKVMYRLAKLGFTQSYTYFTWRNTKAELTEYFTELTATDIRQYFRPNLWPNTPDILPEHLQTGGRGAFVARLVLAATLSSNYGIYGPAFETLEHAPREAGSEEYLNSEKYEIKAWDFERPENLGRVIAAVNRARRENLALQSNGSLRFHPCDNERIICYSKRGEADGKVIVVVVSLNYHEVARGFIELPLCEWGIAAGRPYVVQDLLGGHTFTWQDARNFVELDPHGLPAHIFRVAQA
jgi:starch synthase (maltosyl-transferring)